MGTLLIIIAILMLIKLCFEVSGVIERENELTPDIKALRTEIIDSRKAFIIEDGRRKHLEWQKKHSFLGPLYSYKPDKYYQDNRLNYKRYPL